MRKKILAIVVLFVALINTTQGQVRGPHYRQFFSNPYLFNPAYVGLNNQAELNLSYRQQWVNFKDAPVVTGLNLQFPTSNRVAVGLSLTTDKQVLLRNSTFMATFGYVVPLGEMQSLRFGLSGGMGLNSLDLNSEELNSNDPALFNAADNSFYVDGNAGVVYANSGFKFGFAFTQLFNANSFNGEKFNKFSLSNLKNRFFSMSYRFNLGGMENIAMEPYILYRQSADGLQDSWEAASLIYFKDKIWTGAGYNQNKGLALFLGMNVKDKFKFSYSYEFPPFKSGVSATSAHELHLSLRFGKKKTTSIVKNKPKIYVRPANEVERPKVASAPEKKTSNEKIANNTKPSSENEPTNTGVRKNPEDNKISNEPTKSVAPKTTPGAPAKSFTIAKGHYVVVGVFSMMDHSTKFTKQLLREGLKVNVALNPKNKFYYVYIFSSYDLEEAKKARNQYRRKNLFKEAWVFTMD
jgi:type IX secretion system PorP/SprF family membrane protein